MFTAWESMGFFFQADRYARSVLASCFIPVVMLRPIWVGHCFAVDGGFSNNYPRLEGKQTVLVSPSRSADSEIKPELKLRFRDLIPARFGGLTGIITPGVIGLET